MSNNDVDINVAIARLQVALETISQAVARIEQKLDEQNGRLRIVEQEQARQGVYTGLISTAISAIVGTLAALFGPHR